MILNKSQLVDAIIELNPSARVGFLMDFEESSLRAYLDRLATAELPPTYRPHPRRPGPVTADHFQTIPVEAA